MIISGMTLGCVDEMISIVSMLTVPSIFYRPKEKPEESDAVREKFFVPESDHLTLLNVYEQYVKNGRLSSWCNRNYIHGKAMKKVDEIHKQIVEIVQEGSSGDRRLPSCGGMSGDIDVVRKAIGISYFHNVGKLRGIGEYVNMLTSVPCHLHPTSALYGLGHTPEYIVYHEVVKTTKEYMQCVTAIDPEWLGSEGRKFFSLKYSGAEGRKEREKDREVQREMASKFSIDRSVPSASMAASTTPVNLAGVADTLFINRRKPLVPIGPVRATSPESDSSDSDAGAARRRKNRKK
jgi:pre-mRNA-splicing factor ATP-dependent RNA helicase DHX38/PRP16